MLYGSRGVLSLSRRLQRRRDGERGQILVLFCFALVVILVSASIVIDLGLLRTDRARLQTALDAGALAGGHFLPAKSASSTDPGTLVTTVTTKATSFVTTNYPGIAAPTITYRCLIGYDSTTNLPRVNDMPAVCNVSFAASSTQWQCTSTVCWAPCDPVNISTDRCNTINVIDSATQNYGFGRVVGINSGSTGSMSSAACTGLCGSPPNIPLDSVMIVDRTGSMGGALPDSTATAALRAGANNVLKIFNPSIQRIAFGALGPSSIVYPSTAYSPTCAATPTVNMNSLTLGGSTGISYANTSSSNNSTTATIVRQASGNPNSTTSGPGLNLTAPAGSQAGEVLIAAISWAGTTPPSVTLPSANWHLINMTTNGGGTGVTVASYYLVLAGAPAGPYSFGWTGNRAAVGAIVDYSGVDTTAPIDATGTDSTGNSANVQSTAPGGVNVDMLVGLYGIAAATTFTPPGAMTEAIDSHPTGVAPTLEVADGAHSTLTKTAVAAAGGQWAGHAFELNPGLVGSANLTITRPGAANATGAVLVAAVTVDGGSNTSISALGWTLIRRTDNGTNVGLATYYRVGTGAEAGSYSFTIGGSARAVGTISRYTNVDTTAVLDPAGSSTQGTGTGTGVNNTGITTTQTYTQLIGVYATDVSTIFGAPTGAAERADVQFPTNVAAASDGPTVEFVDDQLPTSGASGAYNATAGAAASGVPWASQTFGLRSMPVDSYNVNVNDPNALKSWIPVGFTGTDSDSPLLTTVGMRGYSEAYSTAGVVNTSTHLGQAAQCFDGSNTGTNLGTPLRMATKYLQTYHRTGVANLVQAIIIETDGSPEYYNNTLANCTAALGAAACYDYSPAGVQAAADAAKAANIIVYTIGYGPSVDPTLLGNMASTKLGTSTCTAAENTDGDDFFCAPTVTDLDKVFQYVAESLSRGPHLIQMYAQPVVTGVAPSTNGNPAGGTVVTITGKFFTEAYSVTFSGLSAQSFTVNSDTSITAIAPPGTLGTTVDIVVSTPGGSSVVVGADHFKYGP